MSAAFGVFLREEYQKLNSRNPQYSIRAFAKKLEISPATASRILSGKQIPSHRVMEKIGKKLGIPKKQMEMFYALSTRSQKLKDAHPHFLDPETFQKISRLSHYVLLNLLKLGSFQFDFKWMAKSIGVTVPQVEELWNRLIEQELIQQDAQGKWVRKHANTTNIKDKRPYIKEYDQLQIQILEQAAEFLRQEPFGIPRDYSALTLAVDSRMIPEARKKIAQFRKEMTAFMESDNPDQVYSLSLALFPLTKIE